MADTSPIAAMATAYAALNISNGRAIYQRRRPVDERDPCDVLVPYNTHPHDALLKVIDPYNLQITWYLQVTDDADTAITALLKALKPYRGDTTAASSWTLDANWHAKRLQIDGPHYLGTDTVSNLHKFVLNLHMQVVHA
jgi:hypothetical protein